MFRLGLLTLVCAVAAAVADTAFLSASERCIDAPSCEAAVGETVEQLEGAGLGFLGNFLKNIADEELRAVSPEDTLTFSRQDNQVSSHNDETSVQNYCPGNRAFEFSPVVQTKIKINTTLTYTAQGFDACYKTMTVSFYDHSPDGKRGGNKWGYLHFKTPLPSKLVCSDSYVAGTKFSRWTLNVGTIDHITKPMHINVTYSSEDEYRDVLQNGLVVMVNPCGGLGTIKSVLATVELFYSNNATAIRQANFNFLTYRKIFDSIKPRSETPGGSLRKEIIKSGDVMQVGEYIS